jgi:outer membrane protein OmpA-like peptidoglycan-associated protein
LVNNEVHSMLKNRPFWFSIGIVAVYLLLGYFAVPPLLQPRLQQWAGQQLGFPVQFEKLRFDPLTWSVDLHKLVVEPGHSPVWPGMNLHADKAHLRFNFWRLEPAISQLALTSPVLEVDAEHEVMANGRYPFAVMWWQWQAHRQVAGQVEPVKVSRWRVGNGQVQVMGDQPTASVTELLDNVNLRLGKADKAGNREYRLDFTASARSASGSVTAPFAAHLEGQILAATAESRGSFRVDYATARLEGAFRATSGTVTQGQEQPDQLLFELTDGRMGRGVELSADSHGCLMDGLLCATWSPPQGTFTARISAATDGFQLLQADAELAGFNLQALLAGDSVAIAGPQAIASGQLSLAMQTPPPDSLARSSARTFEFAASLLATNGDTYALDGHLSRSAGVLENAMATAQFTATGRHVLSGRVQAQHSAATVLREAYSQFSVELENSSASLASELLGGQTVPSITAESLHVDLSGTLGGPSTDAQLELGEVLLLKKVESKAQPGAMPTSWPLPWMQDRQGDVLFRVPARTVSLRQPQQSLAAILGPPLEEVLQVYRKQPLEALATQLGLSLVEPLEIRFATGMAALDGSSSTILQALAEALLQRPGLAVRLRGVFDPLIDRKALQTEQVRTHIALAMAADLSFQSGSVPPDFTDPVVHSVIDEFASRRLPPEVLGSFQQHFGVADADTGVLPEGDVADYYSRLFELLVDHAEIPAGALATLARYRAQAVVDVLRERGVPEQQWQFAGEAETTEARLGGVPLLLKLDVILPQGQ